jgi:lysophospholipase L1-like esterase
MQAVYRTVHDAEGTYTIPFIQSGQQLDVRLHVRDPYATRTSVSIKSGETLLTREAFYPGFTTDFAAVPAGEYEIEVTGHGNAGQQLFINTFCRVGIGAIIAAVGDSITEGYFGRGYFVENIDITAKLFPGEAVSTDGRNFPQYAPTAALNLPSVNTFESWMTALNDLLSADWRVPVFIANEGWGGITSGEYLEWAKNDANWQDRMKDLRPNAWLIHLGVNDERAFVSPSQFAANMDLLVELLIHQFGAAPERIWVAKPCFDYFPGAKTILEAYNEEIERLVMSQGLNLGPDFFAAYQKDKERWYGEDDVHPNEEGMKLMSGLWHAAITKNFPQGLDA